MWQVVTEEFARVWTATGRDIIDLFDCRVGEPVRTSETTEVRRIELEGPPAMTVYLKQYRHGLRYFLRRSRARCEWHNLKRLRQAGLPAPETLAAGEERHFGWCSRAFLVTAEVPGCEQLDEFLERLGREKSGNTCMTRRRLIETLSVLVARMHATGFVHHDLHWRNILVRGNADGPLEFFIMDCPRGYWSHSAARRSAGQRRDLACLDRPAAGVFSRSDRLRFYLHYVGRKRTTAEDQMVIEEIADGVRRLNRKRSEGRP